MQSDAKYYKGVLAPKPQMSERIHELMQINAQHVRSSSGLTTIVVMTLFLLILKKKRPTVTWTVLQAYAKKKKPLTTIRLAGYSVVTGVTEYYEGVLRKMQSGIGNRSDRPTDYSIMIWYDVYFQVVNQARIQTI